MRRGLVILLVVLAGQNSVFSGETAQPADGKAGGVEFARDIQPLLEDRCLSCHGPELQESSLRVDIRQTLLKGGDSETPAVVPGKSAKSELIQRVTATDPGYLMPPEGKPFTKAEVELLKGWIDAGAVMPEKFEQVKRTSSDHWSFQPVKSVEVPPVAGDWVENPVDAFVLARLKAAGLKPAEPADRRMLIRRVTFDLTGLPPTPAEIENFLNDSSPGAYERLVDRLLASSAYGERWGRHWLDVVRYADSNGLDENVAHGNAWRYRDYVIAAFNSDKPYNEFVREQLAGDLLPADDLQARNENLIATGFLSLGPKVLAEVDKTKMEMDIIDEQLDTLGKAFMGLTLGCARCHDHKFDPLTTEDYYSLAGIFKSTRTMETFKTIAKWQEHEIATAEQLKQKEQHQQQVKAKSGEIEQFVKAANEALVSSMAEGAKLPEKPEEQYPEETKKQLKALRDELAALQKAAPVIPTAMGVSEGKATDIPVHQRGSHLSLGKIVPRRMPEVVVLSERTTIPEEESGRRQLAEWLVDPEHPLTSRVIVNRVWRWHFGRGLVESTDNFGELGTEPSHPELLDWLAGQLMDSGWSLKSLHRLILLSNAYRQSSSADAEVSRKAAVVDPENRLLWRANVRRLEAEAIRDSLLAVAGTLDREMNGSRLNTENYKHIFDHTSKDNTRYDFPCRSVYLPIVRNNMYDLFQLFDYTDSSMVNGNRNTSTVAPQALFLMNSDLIAESAKAFAARLLGDSPSDAERIRQMYLLGFGRLPTPGEISRSETFLKSFREALADQPEAQEAERNAWATLCQVLLVSNEFVTVR